MIATIPCPFHDCRSDDIVELAGGAMTLGLYKHRDRVYDGNVTSRSYLCNACGESFTLHYHVTINPVKREYVPPVEYNEPLPFEVFHVPEHEKTTGNHLP